MAYGFNDWNYDTKLFLRISSSVYHLRCVIVCFHELLTFLVSVCLLKAVSDCFSFFGVKIYTMQRLWLGSRVSKPSWFTLLPRKNFIVWSASWRNWCLKKGQYHEIDNIRINKIVWLNLMKLITTSYSLLLYPCLSIWCNSDLILNIHFHR